MSRSYKIYLKEPPASHPPEPMSVEADDVELTGDEPNVTSDYNFLRFPAKGDEEPISIARIPFDMVKAILS